MKLRIANNEDIDFLWKLRNEKTVRQVSLNTEPIPLSEHKEWFSKKKSSSECTIFIVVKGDHSEQIGQVRLDALPQASAEISIALVKAERGRGLGTKVIELALIEAKKRDFKEAKARIKSFNKGSLNAFGTCGFKETKIHMLQDNVDLIEMTKSM